MRKRLKGFVFAAILACAVAGCGGSGDNPTALASETVALPPVITSVVAGDGQVTLVWNVVPGATSYIIYWGTSPGVTKADANATSATNSFTHTGLTNNTTYYYAVSAVNDLGEGSLSSEVSATPRMARPDAPQNPKAVPGYESVTISWDPVDRASSYNIYWATTTGVTKASGTKIGHVTSPYVHAPLAGGTTYYYVVTAVNGGGEGPESAEVSVAAWYPQRRAFVTSTFGTGNLSGWAGVGAATGLAAADAVCAARAQAAGLAGTYKAWISDDADDAYCRVHNLTGKKIDNCRQSTLPAAAGPWIRMDGAPFAESIAQMLDPNFRVYLPVRFDESGHDVGDALLFTDTDAGGQVAWVASPCGNWADAAQTTAGGSSTMTGTGWSIFWNGACTVTAHLLCLETGPGGPLPAAAESGKIAFATLTKKDGLLGGLSGADTFCQQRAEAAHLTGTFHAWLSDGTHDAYCRVQGLSGMIASKCGQPILPAAGGPWVRPDGIKVASTLAELVGGRLLAPINMTETMKYIPGDFAWTGTDPHGVVTAEDCTDWGTRDAGVNSVKGVVTATTGAWTQFTADNCHQPASLYCLEQ